jgi:hypothetical protein
MTKSSGKIFFISEKGTPALWFIWKETSDYRILAVVFNNVLYSDDIFFNMDHRDEEYVRERVLPAMLEEKLIFLENGKYKSDYTDFELIAPPSEDLLELSERVRIVEKTVQEIRYTIDEKVDEDLLKTKVNFSLRTHVIEVSRYPLVWGKFLEFCDFLETQQNLSLAKNQDEKEPLAMIEFAGVAHVSEIPTPPKGKNDV